MINEPIIDTKPAISNLNIGFINFEDFLNSFVKPKAKTGGP